MSDELSKKNVLRNPAALDAFMRGDFENFVAAATPGGIQAQERAGQGAFVQAETLPKEINHPRHLSAEQVYALLGIEILGEADDLFLNVKLPEGWRKVAESHAMWSKLVDDQGRERAAIFYKAAFYDRNAHFTISKRYSYGKRPVGGWGNYNKSEEDAWEGYVTDCGKDVFVTEAVRFPHNERFERVNMDAEEAKEKEALNWVREHYPNFDDPFAYWD